MGGFEWVEIVRGGGVVLSFIFSIARYRGERFIYLVGIACGNKGAGDE